MYLPRIDAGIQMTTRDGVTLTGDLYRPADEGRWPALLHRPPCNRRKSFRVSVLVADPVWLARQGFAVFVQDTRGRAESGGELDFITQEYNDSNLRAAHVRGGPEPFIAEPRRTRGRPQAAE